LRGRSDRAAGSRMSSPASLAGSCTVGTRSLCRGGTEARVTVQPRIMVGSGAGRYFCHPCIRRTSRARYRISFRNRNWTYREGSSMKVALYQDSARPLDLEHNLQLVDRAAAEASAEGAELLITPELFATGYAPSMIREQLGEEAVGEAAEKLAAIARRHRIALVYSLPGRGLSDRRGINAALLDASGDTISEYEKVHLFGPQEKAAFVSGVERPPVVDYAGTKIALVICYDVEFPETVRAAAVGGADLIAVPTALAVGSEQVTRTLIPARALE